MTLFLTSAALTTASFLIGGIFTCLLWDSPLLYGSVPVNAAMIKSMEHYYLSWWYGPTAVKLFLMVIYAVLMLSTMLKFARNSEAAFYFSGTCLFLLGAAGIVYMTVTIPYLRIVAADPFVPSSIPFVAGDDMFSRAQKWLQQYSAKDRPTYTPGPPMSWEDRVMHDSVLSASNSIVLVLLLGVVCLQIGEWYVDQPAKPVVSAEKKKA